MPFTKTIAPLDKGIDTISDDLIIPENAWTKLEQFRIKRKTVRSFPGWKSILAPGQSLGGFGTFAEEFLKFDGSAFFVLGSSTSLFRYNPATKTLTNIGTGFTATRDDPWMGFFYKDELYITNPANGLYKWDGTGNFTAVANAPKARSAEVLRDHICVLNTPTSPQSFEWSAENAPTVWTALATNDAGAFLLDDTPDIGVALYRFADDVVVYKERTIVPITWIGGNEVFARRTAISGVGLIGQYALADMGDSHVFMGPDTFYRFFGTLDVDDQFGRPIRELVYPILHPTFKNRSRLLFIEEAREIIFMFPSSSSLSDCDTWVVYNIDDDTWYGPFPIQSTFGGFTSRAQTLFIDDVTSIIDQTPDIINSFASIIGAPINIFVDSSGNVMQIGGSQDANGIAITRFAESGDHYIGVQAFLESGHVLNYPPESVFIVTAINLFLRSNGVNGSTGQFFIGSRLELEDDISFSGPYTFNLDKTGKARIPLRSTGRWFRIRFSIPNSWEMILVSYQYEGEYMGRR